MSERIFRRQNVAKSTFTNPLLVSPNIPTLANPTRGFGLPTNNVPLKTVTQVSKDLQEAQSADEQLLEPEAINKKPLVHDISRMSLRRPQANLKVSQPGDKRQQEADWVAEQVMSKAPPTTPNVQHQAEGLPTEISSVSQRIQKDNQSETERVRKLNEDYENAVIAKDWQKAAELLNAFNRQDILARLSNLRRRQIGAIHQGALENSRVGSNSQVAELTRATYLDLNYENAKALEDWGSAAKFLNGFNDSDILARVKQLSTDQLPKLRQGATVSMPGWSKRVTDTIDSVVAQSQALDKTVEEIAGGDTIDIKGEPVNQPNYIQNVVKSVGLPIWGGPFYFKRTASPGWSDSVVLQRDELKLNVDPLKNSSLEIKKVYKTRTAADKVVLSFGQGAYTYYLGQDGYIYPTIISPTTAPAMCGVAAMIIEQERSDAKAASNLSVELALWYAGARTPGSVSKPAPKGLIMDAGATLSPQELRLVGKLLQEGRTVRVLAESTKEGVRTADFIVDGVRTELKTIANLTGKDISGSLSRRILDGAGQAPHIIIDARGQTNLTADLGSRAARRAYGFEVSKGFNRIQEIRIIGKDFDVTVPRISE